jgi:hypothetical protein
MQTLSATPQTAPAKPAAKLPARDLFHTARYYIKKGTMEGNICYCVRSIKTVKGRQVANNYQCWIYRDGVIACNCESRKALCCHALFVSELENARDRREAERLSHELDELVAQVDAELSTASENEQPEVALVSQQDGPTAARPVAVAPTLTPKVTQAATPIVALNTVRDVSMDWLLGCGRQRNGTFSGRSDKETA